MKETKPKTELPFYALRIYAVIAIVCFVSACAFWWAYDFSTSMVKQELVAQRIYFPPKGSPTFDSKTYPDLQQYAGQLVQNGTMAKAYANGIISRHLNQVADGKTYAEVSAESMKNPEDAKLATQKQTLFMGQTLRGLLLNAYAFWTIGQLLKVVAITFFCVAILLGTYIGITYRAKINQN